MSNKNNKQNPIVREPIETPIQEAPMDPVETEESIETVIEPKNVTGIVATKLLRLREEPSLDATQITVMSEGTALKIINDDDPKWCWVQVKETGRVGYCMKEFVHIQ